MNGHIPKEINGFLKKLDFKVTFILINETFNLKRLFTFKERQNKLHRSSVVYRITCSCKSTYIGQTSRNLITRLKNHDPNSPNRQDTDVSKHLTDNPDHKIDFDKTEIMAQTNHWRKLLITETLLIKKHNPNLNVDRTSIPLYLFNTWVIWIILSPAAASFCCFICLCFVFFAIHYFWQCEKQFHETSRYVSSYFGFVFCIKDISMLRTLCSEVYWHHVYVIILQNQLMFFQTM